VQAEDALRGFTQNEYALTVTTAGNGSVSRSDADPCHYGDVVTLIATAETDWAFAGWSGT
jgi:hypothetical protein